MKHKRNIWIVLYSLVLAAFTAYFLLDTFVIAKIYAVEGGAEGSQITEIAAENRTSNSA